MHSSLYQWAGETVLLGPLGRSVQSVWNLLMTSWTLVLAFPQTGRMHTGKGVWALCFFLVFLQHVHCLFAFLIIFHGVVIWRGWWENVGKLLLGPKYRHLVSKIVAVKTYLSFTSCTCRVWCGRKLLVSSVQFSTAVLCCNLYSRKSFGNVVCQISTEGKFSGKVCFLVLAHHLVLSCHFMLSHPESQ